MIKILNENKTIEISGHALYADYGKDIVCASVSSIVITTINAIERINKESILYKQNNDSLKIQILDENKIINILIENMIELLKELEEQYPKNIKFL